jgi:hypothetical protein
MEPIPQKPDAAPVNPQWGETPPYRSCLGCLAILAVTSLILCAGLCGGGYYALTPEQKAVVDRTCRSVR